MLRPGAHGALASGVVHPKSSAGARAKYPLRGHCVSQQWFCEYFAPTLRRTARWLSDAFWPHPRVGDGWMEDVSTCELLWLNHQDSPRPSGQGNPTVMFVRLLQQLPATSIYSELSAISLLVPFKIIGPEPWVDRSSMLPISSGDMRTRLGITLLRCSANVNTVGSIEMNMPATPTRQAIHSLGTRQTRARHATSKHIAATTGIAAGSSPPSVNDTYNPIAAIEQIHARAMINPTVRRDFVDISATP